MGILERLFKRKRKEEPKVEEEIKEEPGLKISKNGNWQR